MTRATVEKVCFSIDGEFLTEHCRSLWAREDRQDLAYRTLLEGLQGITHDQVLGILEGRFKLVGNSRDPEGVRMLPDTATKDQPTFLQTIQKLKAERDEAKDEAADLVELCIGETVGIASPTGLRQVPYRKTEMRYIKGTTRRVMKKGYDWADQDPRTRDPKDKDLKIYRETEQSEYIKYKSKVAERPLPPEPMEEPPEPPPTPYDEVSSDFGWLSPEGKFYVCSYAEHRYLAERLMEGGEVKLENAGWVKFGKGLDGMQHIFGFLGDRCKARPTYIQIKLTRDYCLTQHHKFPHWALEAGEPDEDF